jgi:hypothetical protein
MRVKPIRIENISQKSIGLGQTHCHRGEERDRSQNMSGFVSLIQGHWIGYNAAPTQDQQTSSESRGIEPYYRTVLPCVGYLSTQLLKYYLRVCCPRGARVLRATPTTLEKMNSRLTCVKSFH